MAAPIGSLVVKVGSDVRGLNSGFESGRREMRRFGREANSTSRGFRTGFASMKGSIETATAALKTMRNILVALSGLALVRWLSSAATHSIDLGDSFAKLSDRLGISVQFLSEMRFAAEHSGIEFETLSMALQRVIRRMEEFRQTGAGEAAAGFKILGEDISNAVRSGESFESLIGQIADRFSQLENDQQRVLVLFKLFDSEGVKLGPLLRNGAAAIDDLRLESQKLGASWSRLQADQMVKLKDKTTDVGYAFEGLYTELTRAFGPAIVTAVDAVTTSVKALREEALPASDLLNQMGVAPHWGTFNDELKRMEDRIHRAAAGASLFAKKLRSISQATVGPAIPATIRFGYSEPIGPPPSEEMVKRIKEEEDRRQEALRRRVMNLRETLSTEIELENEAYAQRIDDLKDGLDTRILTEQDYRDLSLRLEEQHSDSVKEIKKREAEELARINEEGWKAQAQAVAYYTAQMTGFLAGALETAFGDSKAAAIAIGVLKTLEAASNAYAWGSQFGPAVGAIMAAIAAAAQIARLAQIRSTNLNSGGGVSAASGSSAPATVQPEVVQASNINISLQGDRFGRQQVRDLIREINDAVADGATINVR